MSEVCLRFFIREFWRRSPPRKKIEFWVMKNENFFLSSSCMRYSTQKIFPSLGKRFINLRSQISKSLLSREGGYSPGVLDGLPHFVSFFSFSVWCLRNVEQNLVVTFSFFNLHGHFASRSQEMQIEGFKRYDLLKKNENSEWFYFLSSTFRFYTYQLYSACKRICKFCFILNFGRSKLVKWLMDEIFARFIK